MKKTVTMSEYKDGINAIIANFVCTWKVNSIGKIDLFHIEITLQILLFNSCIKLNSDLDYWTASGVKCSLQFIWSGHISYLRGPIAPLHLSVSLLLYGSICKRSCEET